MSVRKDSLPSLLVVEDIGAVRDNAPIDENYSPRKIYF